MILDAAYSADFIIQYSLVGLCLLGACVWIGIKLFKKNKYQNQSGCCGCGLADNCAKKKLVERKKEGDIGCENKIIK